MSGSDDVRGTCKVDFGDVVHEAKATWGAARDIEADRDAVGLVAQRAVQDLSITDVVTVLYHCLRAAGVGVDWDWVGDRVVARGVASYMPAMDSLCVYMLQGGGRSKPNGEAREEEKAPDPLHLDSPSGAA